MEYIELFKASKKALGEDIKCKKARMAILADSSSQHIKTAIKGYGVLEKISFEIFDADYNQIEFQVFNENSDLYEFSPEYILLFMCPQKLYEQYCVCEKRVDFAQAIISQIEGYYNAISQRINAHIIQPIFVEDDDRIFGNYALSVEESFAFQVKKINMELMQLSTKYKNVFLMDPNIIVSEIGKSEAFDYPQYCNSKMAFSLKAVALFAREVVGIIKAKLGIVKKCVILDLDNTLWGGVIGDDGIDGIELGELGIGHAFYEFQMWLRELKKRGILLCICSKNNDNTAREPFEKHPDMVLKLDDITMFVANWEDKASNIRMIQSTLNIGMDSMVFIDDNPYERDMVRNMIPEILVPDMPEDPALYKSYLQSLNLFETVSYSENDTVRTKQYQEEVGRTELKKFFSNFDEYLKGLEMVGYSHPFEKYYFPRVAQLTQRSNQFNLRTVRYTEDEIEKISKDENYLTQYFTLKDKFGDYGLISVVILKKINDADVFVDTWLMSCRVLKRGVEEFVVNSFVELAKKNGYKRIMGEYIKTPKNSMVEHLYEQYGFKTVDSGKYELIIDEYIPFNHFITISE